MKKYLLLAVVISLLTPLLLFAQAKEEEKTKEPPTKLEAFLAKKGKLIVKDSYTLGEMSGTGKTVLDALVIYEPGLETQKIRGIRVEITEAGRLERSNTSFLDLDEVESLSKAIAYMTDLAGKWSGAQREAYTEVIYSTKGDFKLGFYQQGTDRSAFTSSGYIGKASMYFGVDDFAKLKAIIDKGLNVLNQKK